MTTPLLPPTVPAFRSRSGAFDQAVMEAIAELAPQWPDQFGHLEFAVDEVPPVTEAPLEQHRHVVTDGPVPLSIFVAPGVDARGRTTKARIVLYRRPLQWRVPPGMPLVEVVLAVMTEQLTAIFGPGAADS